MKEYKIYVLINPNTQEIRYVGVTTGYLSQRLSQHKHAAIKKNSGTRVCKWIRSLNKEGILPIIKLIDSCTEKNWEEREKYWIRYYNNLTNTHEGGKGVIINRKKESIERSIDGHKKEVIILDLQYNFVKEFTSVKECANFLNVGLSAVSNVLSKKWSTKSASKHIILYKKDYEDQKFEKNYKSKHRKIYQYSISGTLINTFNSITEAFNLIKPCKYSSGVFEAVKNKHKCGGFYWTDRETIDFSNFSGFRKKKEQNGTIYYTNRNTR